MPASKPAFTRNVDIPGQKAIANPDRTEAFTRQDTVGKKVIKESQAKAGLAKNGSNDEVQIIEEVAKRSTSDPNRHRDRTTGVSVSKPVVGRSQPSHGWQDIIQEVINTSDSGTNTTSTVVITTPKAVISVNLRGAVPVEAAVKTFSTKRKIFGGDTKA